MQRGIWAALTNKAALDPVVEEAVESNDENSKIHKIRPPLRRLFGCYRA